MIELGAQWVHGEKGNVVFPLAAEAGEIRTDIETLESTGLADNVATAYRDGSKISSEKMREFQQLMADVNDAAVRELIGWNKSLGEYFQFKYTASHTSTFI